MISVTKFFYATSGDLATSRKVLPAWHTLIYIVAAIDGDQVSAWGPATSIDVHKMAAKRLLPWSSTSVDT